MRPSDSRDQLLWQVHLLQKRLVSRIVMQSIKLRLNLIAYRSESFSAYARSSHLKASSDSPRNAYTVATPDGLVLLEMATKIGRNSHAAFKGAASTRNAIMGLRLDAAR